MQWCRPSSETDSQFFIRVRGCVTVSCKLHRHWLKQPPPPGCRIQQLSVCLTFAAGSLSELESSRDQLTPGGLDESCDCVYTLERATCKGQSSPARGRFLWRKKGKDVSVLTNLITGCEGSKVADKREDTMSRPRLPDGKVGRGEGEK